MQQIEKMNARERLPSSDRDPLAHPPSADRRADQKIGTPRAPLFFRRTPSSSSSGRALPGGGRADGARQAIQLREWHEARRRAELRDGASLSLVQASPPQVDITCYVEAKKWSPRRTSVLEYVFVRSRIRLGGTRSCSTRSCTRSWGRFQPRPAQLRDQTPAQIRRASERRKRDVTSLLFRALRTQLVEHLSTTQPEDHPREPLAIARR